MQTSSAFNYRKSMTQSSREREERQRARARARGGEGGEKEGAKGKHTTAVSKIDG